MNGKICADENKEIQRMNVKKVFRGQKLIEEKSLTSSGKLKTLIVG